MNETLFKHKIKVPIFSSEVKEENPGELFDSPDYTAMLDYIKSKINTFKNNGQNITQSRNNKVKEMQISNIDYFDSEFEKIPTLLLKITAFNTNLIDGFVETDTKRTFKKEDKIGSDTNYVLVFPSIYGNDSSKFTYQWKFFVYDDPTKETHEIISICKLAVRKVLDIKIRNLKLEKILKEIKAEKIIENIEIQLSSQFEETDDPDIKLTKYLVKSKVAKTTKNKYKDIPSDIFESLINEKPSNFLKRVFKITKNKKEIRITQENYKNDLDRLNNTIEEIFNTQLELNQSDLEKLFEFEFIIRNLNSSLTDFITQSE